MNASQQMYRIPNNYRLEIFLCIFISIFISIMFGKIEAIAQPNSPQPQDGKQSQTGKSCLVIDPLRKEFSEDAQDDPFFQDILWTKQSENQWLSSTDILIDLYPDHASWSEELRGVGSSLFWKSRNAYEAYEILNSLEKFPSPQELNVSSFFFRHSSNGWRAALPQATCGEEDGCAGSPYRLHYLYSPDQDWIIDHLMAHAKGFVRLRGAEEDYPFITILGPYQPIFQGRFTLDNHFFWFSARDADNNPPWSFSMHEVRSIYTLSTAESRLATLQDINNFIEACLLAND